MERKRALATAAAITMSVVSGTIALGAGLTASSAQPASVPAVATQTATAAQPAATQTATAAQPAATPRVVTVVVPNKAPSQPRGHESGDGSKAGGQDD